MPPVTMPPSTKEPVVVRPCPPTRAKTTGTVISLAEQNVLSVLQPVERAHFAGMKRKERMEIACLVNASNTGRRETPLRIKVLQSNLPHHLRMQIFEDMGRNQCEKYVNWVRRIITLPLGVVYTQPKIDVQTAVENAVQIMERTIAGHEDAKREVLKLVCQQSYADGLCSSNYSLGFEGPPGTGKTHFVTTALAKALGRPLVSIPLGGANDVAYLLGHLYVYEGSKEGRLASALIESRCCNPILYFDEVDKLACTERGAELTAALIHLIDPTANCALRDRYFHGVDIDFSKCSFVFSYNDPDRVSPILLDRIKRVSMPVPTDEERSTIVRDHLVPRVQKRLNSTIGLSEEAIQAILERSRSAKCGMRSAEKDVDHAIANAQLCRACGQTLGTMAGANNVPVFTDSSQDHPKVTGAFVSSVLPKDQSAKETPPSGMYT